jgi:Dyp-type peroxidase family
MSDHANPVDHVDLKLHDIQGNILAGFNNDHQRFLFLRIDDAHKAKTWLKNLIPKVSTTAQVKASNDKFKANGKIPVHANWLNVAINHPGLEKLGAPNSQEFPAVFQEGMANRNAHLGDVGPSAPDQWDPWFRDRDFLDILVLLSADDPGDLAKSLADVIASIDDSGLTLIHTQAGENAPGLNGNEHFGFKDGISQPGVKGFTLSTVLPQPDKVGHQGLPGQDLLWPGEFVLGYPTQDKRRPTDFDGPNPAKGPVSASGPDWTKNGSYLVFRKLGQDVAGFRNSIRANAAALAVDPEVLGAKIVGRFRSGCPMEPLKDDPTFKIDTNSGDPSLSGHPNFTDQDHKVFFEYGADPKGIFVPRSSHIRKAYPRDEQLLKSDGTTPDVEQDFLHESDTQTHRVLRRGIPFGVALPMADKGLSAQVTDDEISRGLLFLCYQSDLERQFEFIQTKWVNNHNFPEPGDGADPVMSQVSVAPMKCPFKSQSAPVTFDLKHFVTTNGGEYFFQPSISALSLISG